VAVLMGKIATYFDCSGSPACQSYTCSHNGGNVAAWPKLRAGYQDFNSIQGCDSAYPWLSCGTFVTVKNVDSRTGSFKGRSIQVQIVTALPESCPSITGLPKPIGIDLARSVFTYLAGSTSYGYIDVEITV
jgi:hypothetical protein